MVAAFTVSQKTMMGGKAIYQSNYLSEVDEGVMDDSRFSPVADMGSPVASPASRSKSSEIVANEETIVAPESEKKIIKNGNLSLKVDNVDRAGADILKIARDNEGEVASSNVYQSGSKVKRGNITVKVPVKNFEKTFSELKKVASLVISESTSGADVTEQYADLQAQIKNKKAEEEAFVRIMTQAQKIDDILAVQRELSRVRGQIEQIQGRIKYMESQTDMSTISVSLSEDASISIADRWRPLQVAKESASVLIKKVQNFVDFVIRLIILVLPVFILYLLLVLVVFKVVKRIYLKFKKKEPNQS